jgi:hypothetical protein
LAVTLSNSVKDAPAVIELEGLLGTIRDRVLGWLPGEQIIFSSYVLASLRTLELVKET